MAQAPAPPRERTSKGGKGMKQTRATSSLPVTPLERAGAAHSIGVTVTAALLLVLTLVLVALATT